MTTVMDYDSAVELEGRPSDELVRESSAVDTGAVPAYLEHGVWQYCQPSMVDQYERTQGLEVRTVYVEGDGMPCEAEPEPEPKVEPRSPYWDLMLALCGVC